MVVGDPALVVILTIGARDHGGLGVRVDGLNDLGLADLLGGLGPLRLGEQRLDPCLINEVKGAGEDGAQEDVEEDTRREVSVTS